MVEYLEQTFGIKLVGLWRKRVCVRQQLVVDSVLHASSFPFILSTKNKKLAFDGFYPLLVLL